MSLLCSCCENLGCNWFTFLLAIVVWICVKKVMPRRLKSVDGDVVLITGGGGDLGKLFAKRFLVRGATVILWDVNEAGLKDAVEMLTKYGRVHSYICDISNRETVYAVAKRVEKEVGEVTILVNNAAIMPAQEFFKLRDEVLEKTIAINTTAHFWTVKAFVPQMIKRNSGHVVCIASSAGFVSVPRLAEYCASKAGAAHFAESLRHELRMSNATGVRVTTVAPYAVNTALAAGWKDSIWMKLCGLSLLDPEHVADMTVEGTLANEHLIFIPRHIKVFWLVRILLPVWLQDRLVMALGGDHLLDSFSGRGKALH